MQNVLIIGATSDIAKELAYQLASQNTNIILAGRNIDLIDPISKDIEIRFNVQCKVKELDILAFDDHQRFVDSLDQLPDVTIFLAGYLGNQRLANNNWFETEKILSSNFIGAVSILNLLANWYEKHGQGVIAVFSSVAGERGRQSNYTYGSAKAGLTTFLSGLRNRLFHSGVHVLTIKPGFMATRMTEDLNLPSVLTANPDKVAKKVIKSIRTKKNTVYILWFWQYIMLIIKLIPEGIFKKMKL